MSCKKNLWMKQSRWSCLNAVTCSMWEAQILKYFLRVMSSWTGTQNCLCHWSVPFESSFAATLLPLCPQVNKLILWIRREFILEPTVQSLSAKLWIVQVRLELPGLLALPPHYGSRLTGKESVLLEPALDAVQTQENRGIINFKLLNCSSRRRLNCSCCSLGLYLGELT